MDYPLAKTVVTAIKLKCPYCDEEFNPPAGASHITPETFFLLPTTVECDFCSYIFARPPAPSDFYSGGWSPRINT